MLHLNKVHHIAIICSDYQRSLDFYTRILGMRVLAEHYRESRQSYKTDLALDDEYVVELFSFPSPPPRVTHPEAAGFGSGDGSLTHFFIDALDDSITNFQIISCFY